MNVSEHTTLTDTWKDIYRVDFIQTLLVSHLNVCNTRTQKTTVSLCAVRKTETPSAENAILWDYSLNGNDFKEICSGVVLVPGMSLQGRSSLPNVVTCKLCGRLSA